MKVHYTIPSIFMFALIKKKKNQNFDQIVEFIARQPLSPGMPPTPYTDSSLRISFASISEHNYILNLSLLLVSATRNAPLCP